MATATAMTVVERTLNTASTRKTKLEATNTRIGRQAERNADSVNRAEAALVKAQARVERVKAKQQKDAEKGAALIAKQTAELETAVQAHEKAKATEQAKVDAAKAKAEREAAKDVGGTVETESGKVINLPVSVCEVIKSAIGRRRKGTLTTKDGDEVSVLDALAKAIEPDLLGDVFEVSLKGRKTVVLFTLADGETRFETESK